VERAVADFESGELNLGQAARQAGVSVERMIAELDRRGIELVTPDQFVGGLEHLAETFGGSRALCETIADLRAHRPPER
jgi:hypothetical protein